MAEKILQEIEDVKAVTFEAFNVSQDGEMVVFTVRDKAGNTARLGIDWLKLGLTTQLICRGGESAAEVRQTLGKSDLFEGADDMTFQLVSTFQVSDVPAHNLKILSLQSPTGFRCDFAIPTDAEDQRGRLYPRAIAEELLADSMADRERPH